MRDAANRARAAAEAAGARLGPVRVIDPSGRACQTDVLAGWPSYDSGAPSATTVEASRREDRVAYAAAPPAMSIPITGARVDHDARLTLQPPLRWLSAQACVVYGLN